MCTIPGRRKKRCEFFFSVPRDEAHLCARTLKKVDAVRSFHDEEQNAKETKLSVPKKKKKRIR